MVFRLWFLVGSTKNHKPSTLRFETRIAVTGILTYLVFGLANLFGQPGKFVPPVLLDYFFLSGLALFFLFRLDSKLDFFSLLFLCVSFVIAGIIETGLMELLPLPGFILLITAFLLNIASVLMNRKQLSFHIKLTSTLFYLCIFSFVIIFFNNIYAESNNGNYFDMNFASYIYWFSGLLGMILGSFRSFYSQLTNGQVRFFTLYFLSAFFDFANYFSLYLLVS